VDAIRWEAASSDVQKVHVAPLQFIWEGEEPRAEAARILILLSSVEPNRIARRTNYALQSRTKDGLDCLRTNAKTAVDE
jgi:hypothetical protein